MGRISRSKRTRKQTALDEWIPGTCLECGADSGINHSGNPYQRCAACRGLHAERIAEMRERKKQQAKLRNC